MDYDMIPECTIIVGPSGCGKTHTLLNLLKGEKLETYDYIFILCPTYDINDAYMTSGIRDPCMFGVSITPDKLDKVVALILKKFSGDCRTAIVVDDMSSSAEQHGNYGKLNYLAYSGRHHGISLYLLTQKLSSVSTGIRDNATRVIFFPTHCKRSLKTLRDEFLGCLETYDAEQALVMSLSDRNTIYIDIDLTNRTQKVATKHG